MLFEIVMLPAFAGERVLWTIGRHDDSAAEFAQGWYTPSERRGRGVFPVSTGRPVVYRVGVSTEAHDWPAVQPSDYDPEGGAQDHPFTILFHWPRSRGGMRAKDRRVYW